MGRGYRTEKTFDFFRDFNKSDGLIGSLLARLGKRGWCNYSKQHIELTEDWLQKPLINAEIAITGNINFEVLGTNAVTADVTFRTGGGITLTTHGSANDSTIIAPHLDTTQTAWAVASWLTQKQPRYEATIQFSSSVAAQTVWYGGKLTNTPVIATDNDQAFFRFDTTSTLGASYLHFITSRGGTDTDDILSLAPAASGVYTLVIEIDDLMKPHIYINGQDFTGELSAAGAAPLVTAKNLIPYVGVLQTGATAKSIGVLPGYKISRTAA